MMRFFTRIAAICCILLLQSQSSYAQTTLVNFDFTSTTLPAEITSNGVISPTKAADGVCSKGMIQVNSGQYISVSLSSCSYLQFNMKSTSSSARTLRVAYKTPGATDSTIVTTTLSVLAAQVFDLTTLYPALVSNLPIVITLVPTNGNIQVHDIIARASNSLNTEANIAAFKLPGQIGTETINSTAGTIGINVATGTDLTNVAPTTLTLSGGATISPVATTTRNFSPGQTVNYTVTSQDGTTSKNWTITTQAVASSAKEITAFQLSPSQLGTSVINSSAGTIMVNMPIGSDLTNIVPQTLSISANATISPLATAAQNFSSPVVYTVTAEDATTKTFTVTVMLLDPNATFTHFEAEDAQYTGVIDNKHAGYSGTGFVDFLATGDNQVNFTVCMQQAGTQTAKFRYALGKVEDRAGNLYVNDVFIQKLSFAPTPTFTDWAEEFATIQLAQGVNNIRINWDTTDGPNLDRMALSGAFCATYPLTLNTTNNGQVSLSPARKNNQYFAGESVTLLASNTPSLVFDNWSGDATGTTNPLQIVMNQAKTITGNFHTVATYTLTTSVEGIGEVKLSPAGGQYAAGTEVTLTPNAVLGSSFLNWTGDATGNTQPLKIIMDGNKNVKAVFNNGNISIDFNKVIGFASITANGFTGSTTGGSLGTDTVFIHGPSEFNLLCQLLYNRIQYKNYHKRPLTIVLEEGVYTGAGGEQSVWANSMLTIQEQADLTIIGRKNVVLNFGINVKRSWNIIIRNITFQDYYDDGINIGEPETHHIWVDHCTVGHPTTLPANTEHPDGGIDVKAGSSYITISWTKYRNNWKNGLVGHSDNNGGEDEGRLKTTYFANHFYHTNSRNPRVRFGEVHVLNCLEEHVMLYGIAASNNSRVVAEGNFFLNTRWPMYADLSTTDFKAKYGNNTDNTFTSKTGNYPCVGLRQFNNDYDDSGLPVITAQINPAMLNPGGRSIKFDEHNAAGIFDPHSYYDYTPFPASAVRVLVPMFAGADVLDFSAFGNNGSLPLKLVSFKGETTASGNQLTWVTSSEENVSHFEIEKSANAQQFSRLGNVQAKNSQQATYRYTDAINDAPTAFYRLKMVDKDAKYSYSPIVKLSKTGGIHFSITPNPAAQHLLLNYSTLMRPAVARLIDFHGKTLSIINLPALSNQTKIDISNLANGMYIISTEIDGKTMTERFMKKQ